MDRQQEFVLRTLEERDIRFVRLWFTDVLGLAQVGGRRAGRARGRVRRGHRLRRLGDRGLRPGLRVGHARQARPVDVPGAAVARREPGHGPDVLRHPDARRLAVATPTRATCCKRALAKAADLGFTFYTHPEIEFFLLEQPARRRASRRCRSTRPATSTTPRTASAHDFRRPAITMLESMGISVEFSHHEGAPGPAGDRPALRRRADHRRQHHDLPAR